MARIAFLGLGRMGQGMAARLIESGHDVHVWNRTRSKAEAVLAKGAKWAQSPAVAAAGADAVVAMLADDPAAEAVWRGKDGALAAVPKGAMVIECSTLSKPFVVALAKEASALGLRFIDCPVTGRPDAAAAGKLTLLVGAAPDDLAAARPLLETMSTTIRHFGLPGQGTAYKLLINLMGAVQIAALAEGLVFAERLGLDREAVVEAIADSASASRQVVHHVGRMARRTFDNPTFTATLRHKDAAYAARLAGELGCRVPLGDMAVAWFDAAKAINPDGDEGYVIDAVAARKS